MTYSVEHYGGLCGNLQEWERVIGIANLSEWERVCDILSGMRGLEELKVDIDDPEPTVSPHLCILEPLMALTAVKDFEVRTGWPLSVRSLLGEGVPFRLVERAPIEGVEVASLVCSLIGR